MIRCKFRCSAIQDNGHGVPKEVTFETLYDPKLPEDQRYTKWTPWGSLKVSIDNPAALALLEVGKFFYIDISPVE